MEILIIIFFVAVLVTLIIYFIAQRRELNKTKQELSEYECFMKIGATLYSIKEFSVNIAVFGRYWDGEKYIELLLKRYHFTDRDSRDYAIRCAEELIEKLEERI